MNVGPLERLGACCEAVERARAQKSPRAAWAKCRRADWMLWLATRVGVDRRLVVLAACDCAETAQPHWNEHTAAASGDAITTARAWARGDATIEEVRAAANAAAAAAAAAAAFAAANAAAAFAAANAAAAAAAAVADATRAAAAAYADAADADARGAA